MAIYAEQLEHLVKSLSLGRLHTSRGGASLLRRTTARATKQAAHHVHERVALPWALDTKVHFSDQLESLAPCADLGDIRRVLRDELLVDVRRAALDGEQEEAEEVEEGQAREDAQVGAVAADILDAEALVVVAEGRGEETVGGVGRADVANEEVWEDGARGV